MREDTVLFCNEKFSSNLSVKLLLPMKELFHKGMYSYGFSRHCINTPFLRNWLFLTGSAKQRIKLLMNSKFALRQVFRSLVYPVTRNLYEDYHIKEQLHLRLIVDLDATIWNEWVEHLASLIVRITIQNDKSTW